VVAAAPAPADAADIDGSAAQIRRGRLELHFASARVFADAPSKASRADARLQPGEAMAQSLALMSAARSDVTIASPYFVPGAGGLELMREAAARGIDIAVMTNSLGATDEPLAYRGYRRYRLPMLKMGVRLAELSPVHGEQSRASGVARSSLGRLHAKLAIVDQRWLLVGSLNMDRRSSRLNTELALAIDSPALAGEAAALLQRLWANNNYQLRLAPAEDRIQWVAQEGGQPVVHEVEPHADWVGQWRLRLMSLLVSEELL
jgi:putative cardiolipin synthase